MATRYGKRIVTDGLVLCLDAADNISAPHNDLPVKQGCVTWLDGADDDVFSYSSGTLVSQWRDKSGNDNHVNQSTTSSQPTRNRTLNSKSVVDFDGSNDSLSSSNSLTLSSGHTMFAVTLIDAFSSDAGLISINNQLSNGITIHTSGLAYFYFGSGGYNTTQSVSTSTSYILTKVWTGATSGNRISYKNGTQGYSTGTMANSNSTGVLRLGQQSTYYNGYIAEVVIYNRELSQDEITKVHNYLQNKWNISVSDTKWYDQTANANNGTPTNDPTYSETNKGYFDFDGSDDYININHNSVFDTNIFTIEIWFKSTTDDNTHDSLITRNGDVYSSANGWSLGKLRNGLGSTTNALRWLVWGTSTYTDLAGDSTASGNWTQAVGVSDGTNLYLYQNAVQKASGSKPAGNIYPSIYGFKIGANKSSSDIWNGQIAKINFYNKALTAAEILQNYNATKSRFT